MSGGGKFNYQGTKRWIEDALDNPTSSSETVSSLLANVDVVLCLDSLATNPDQLHVHVSKPPKEDTPTHAMYSQIQKVSTADNVLSITYSNQSTIFEVYKIPFAIININTFYFSKSLLIAKNK